MRYLGVFFKRNISGLLAGTQVDIWEEWWGNNTRSSGMMDLPFFKNVALIPKIHMAIWLINSPQNESKQQEVKKKSVQFLCINLCHSISALYFKLSLQLLVLSILTPHQLLPPEIHQSSACETSSNGMIRVYPPQVATPPNEVFSCMQKNNLNSW